MAGAAICFSPHDAAFAKEMAAYLEFHTSLRFDLAECTSDFLDSVEQCLANELVIVVLSPAAAPSLWPRADWERVLIQAARESESQIAYVMRETCPFPQILRRRNFFEGGFRALRRWLIQQLDPEPLSIPITIEGERDDSLLALVEEPGVIRDVTVEQAAWIARNHWQDFEAVRWVRFSRRSRIGVLGELAHAMNLRLPGTAEQNWLALKQQASEKRALLLLQNLPAEHGSVAELDGKASVLVIAGGSAATGQYENTIGGVLDGEQTLGCWAEMRSLAMQALLPLKQQARLAEAHELLAWMAREAHRHNDFRALEQIRWEEDWILDAWDLPATERTEMVRTQPSQLWLAL